MHSILRSGYYTMLIFGTRLISQVILALTVLLSASIALAANVPCQSTIPMWCLDWEPHYQVWDPDGTKDFQDLPEGLLTATLIDRKANQLLVGPVQLGGTEKPLGMTMVLDDRIESRGWTDGVHLHSSSDDEFDLRLILHAAPQYLDPELALPNQDPLPLDAEFHIGGVLKLGDEEHVWLFPTYWEEPVKFNRLRAAGADTAKGFSAYIDIRVANRRIEPETLTLYIDADADGQPERTIDAFPLTDDEHDKLIAAARAKAREREQQREYTPVIPAGDWQWEWVHPYPSGNSFSDLCRAPNGDLYAVDEAGFVLRRHEGAWTADSGRLAEGLRFATSAPDGEIYVAGSSHVWRRGDGEWVDMRAPEVGLFRGIYAWENQELLVITHGGEILHHGPNGWRRSSVGDRLILTGAWGASPDDVWVTGYSGKIFRYDGTNWTAVETDFWENINGVWGASPHEVYFITSRRKAKIWRWTERSGLQHVRLEDNPVCDFTWIDGADGTVDMWELNSVRSFDRRTWTQIDGPPAYKTTDICRDAEGKFVAVGEGGRIWEHGAEGWQEVYPRPRPRLRAVWGLSESDLYAVCGEGRVWHWDGMRLAEMDSLHRVGLDAIWGTSSRDIHVAGPHGLWHWDGDEWTKSWDPWRGGIRGGFSMWGARGDEIWAVGLDGIMLHYRDGEWEHVAGVPEKDLRAIWGSASDDIYVGGGKILLHYDGEQWSTVPGFKRLNVSHLWGSGPMDVWASTDQGLYHYDGDTWERTNLREWTTGVWGTGATDVFTLTQDQLLQFDGREWRSVQRIDYRGIRGLWCRPGEDLLAFGNNGAILILHR